MFERVEWTIKTMDWLYSAMKLKTITCYFYFQILMFTKVSDCCLMLNEQFFRYIMARTIYLWWDDSDVSFVLDQHA